MNKPISLTEVKISEGAIKRVEGVLRSGRIGQGPLIEEFEEKFSDWIGSRYAVAVSSGTMADTIALAVMKFISKSGKNNVYVPSLTFAAQINSVLYNNLKPVFYDHGEEIKDSHDALCVFPVHLLGIPDKKNLGAGVFIEDSCEAMGSTYLGKKCGTFGLMGTFSFFPSHTMTTGEGGMIVTDDKECYETAKRLRNHGKNSGVDFHFKSVGFNGKMTSLQAALGIEALKTIDAEIAKRRNNYLYLGGSEPEGCKVSPHAFPLLLSSKEERDAMMKTLLENGIECRNLFSSLPTQEEAYSMYSPGLGSYPISEKFGDCGLYVPCHQYLEKEDLDRIKEILSGQKEKTQREVLTA